jgi:pimeloyl-ACP methyl ester carboxylesterase
LPLSANGILDIHNNTDLIAVNLNQEWRFPANYPQARLSRKWFAGAAATGSSYGRQADLTTGSAARVLYKSASPEESRSGTMPIAAPVLFRPAGLVFLLSLACSANAQTTPEGASADKGKTMHVTSRDGTRIAYDTWGKGPAIILVNGALADRKGNAELAQLLADRFTVYSYDRRGRGDSTDTKPYSVKREIEDMAALIDAAGGSAFLYGKSSGASLALQAAAALGGKVEKLALYEAPYNDAEGAAREWKEFTAKLEDLLAADRRAESVTLFLKFAGVPDEVFAKLKASPAWAGMLTMAPTLSYDNAVVGEDRSVPVAIAARVKADTLVMDGGGSLKPMPFMRATADKLGKTIPGARRQVIEGQAHDVSSKVLAPLLLTFFE